MADIWQIYGIDDSQNWAKTLRIVGVFALEFADILQIYGIDMA